jgi:hypothetical protein
MRHISRAWPGALRALGFVPLLLTHAGRRKHGRMEGLTLHTLAADVAAVIETRCAPGARARPWHQQSSGTMPGRGSSGSCP